MKWYIAVDGGGSKTEAIVFDNQGNIYGRSRGLGTNPLFIKKEEAFNNLNDVIKKVIKKSNLTKEQITKMYLFIPGLSRYEEEIKALVGDNSIIKGDEYAAFYGALGTRKGIVVLSGTGSFAFASKEKGEWVSVGGWGPIFGDEGSGYDIGIRALKTVAIQYDLKEPLGLLGQEIMEYFEINDVNALKSIQNTEKFNRDRVAGLCKVVLTCANQGDSISIEIFRRVAYSLAELVKQVAQHLDIEEECPFSLIGGVMNVGKWVEEPLKEYVETWYPNLHYEKAKFAPIIGAMLYALDDLGVYGGVYQKIIQNDFINLPVE